MNSDKKMKVEIWSDVMCPFCYIGKRHFEQALEQFSNKEQIAIEWKSFQLDLSLPEKNTGEDAYTYLSKRKGISQQQVKQMHEHVTQMATAAGLEYNLENTAMVNSFKAHRLLQLAKQKGLDDAAEEALFYANFTLNKDFSNDAVLKEIGEQIGLSEEEVTQALTDETYANKVNIDILEAQQLGISGVPFFVLNNKYGISGAQPAEAFTQALQQSFSEWEQTAAPLQMMETATGEACKADGSNC